MKMEDASKMGIYYYVTGNINVLREEHFNNMKDGAIIQIQDTLTSKLT